MGAALPDPVNGRRSQARIEKLLRPWESLGRPERFVEQGIAGIEKDAPRSGRPRTILPPQIDEILRLTTRETPPAATHWRTRTLAQVSKVSFSTVGRIWRAHGLKPRQFDKIHAGSPLVWMEGVGSGATAHSAPGFSA
jgi:hypothetical protein